MYNNYSNVEGQQNNDPKILGIIFLMIIFGGYFYY